MEIKEIFEDKRRFMDLLLLGDEQENMIDRYLERGDLFALYEGDLRGVCVVTSEGDEIGEIKNIAITKEYQGCGYGRKLIHF